MQFPRLDALFRKASMGDKEAYQTLYNEFQRRANELLRQTIRNTIKFRGNPEDFSDLIDDVFFKSINEFDEDRSSYTSFADFVLKSRFIPYVQRTLYEIQANTVTFYDENSKGTEDCDFLADPNNVEPMTESVMNNFKLKIASPLTGKTKEEKMRQRILLLQYAGYNKKEMANILDITYNQLRFYLEKIKDSDEVVNLKLELK